MTRTGLLVVMTAAVCTPALAGGGSPTIDPRTRAVSIMNAGLNGFVGAPDAGPDVIVGELMETQSFSGAMSLTLAPFGTVGNVSAYAVGTTSCNIGTQNLKWIDNTNEHPVIGQNFFRLKNGRLEQIGLGWVKHGFFALTFNACSNEGYFCNGQGGSVLGVGCSDPYDASLNGSWSTLGPRWQVNASTGVFPYPYQLYPNVNALSKRIQVAHADIEDTTLNPDTRYFADAMYVTQDDTAAGNNANNSSYRRMTVNGATRVFTLTDQTQRRKPAIHAWKDYGGPGGTADPNVILNAYDIQGDGRFWFASKATPTPGGWHYEYAVYNLTSHRSAGSVAVPIPGCAQVSGPGFHDVNYHSGEPFSGQDWGFARTATEGTWSCVPLAIDPNGNAVRWGTMYNYWFDSDLPPDPAGAITVGLFRAPTASSPAVSFDVVGAVPRHCKADFNGDCALTVADFGAFQTAFVAGCQ
jgi:hypothetical protein